MHDVATVTLTPIPASVYVACPATWCPAFGVQRLVWLKQVAVGVIAIPTLMCQTCHSVLNLPLCLDLEETPVPKLHADREPTNRHDPVVAATPAAEAVAEPVEAAPAETTQAAETAVPARKATPRKAAARKAGGDS